MQKLARYFAFISFLAALPLCAQPSNPPTTIQVQSAINGQPITPSSVAAGTAVLGPDGGNVAGCKTASSMGFLLNGTDESTALIALLGKYYTAGGGCLYIDDGKTLRADSQIVIPNAGSSGYRQPPIRITSGSNSANYSDAIVTSGVPNGGGRLDLRYHGGTQYGGGPKLLTLGSGSLTIDHITLTSGAGTSDCAAFLMTTQTTLLIDHTTFLGTVASNGTNYSCNDAIILGGVNSVVGLTGTTADRFGGYGTQIHDNFFSKIRRQVVMQNVTNGVSFHHNTNDRVSGNNIGDGAAIQIIGGGGTDIRPTLPATCAPGVDLPIYLSVAGGGHTVGVNACTSTNTWTNQGATNWQDQANDVSFNLIEADYYTMGIDTANAIYSSFINNQIWDGSTTLYCGDQSSSGSIQHTQGALSQAACPAWWSYNWRLSQTASDSVVPASMPAQYKTWSCQAGLGDGLNAIPAGTYLQNTCYNDSGVTQWVTGIKCYTDNSGTSTMNVSSNGGGALLTGAVTCSTAFAAGTQGALQAISNGDYLKFTFVADGSSKQTAWVMSGTK